MNTALALAYLLLAIPVDDLESKAVEMLDPTVGIYGAVSDGGGSIGGTGVIVDITKVGDEWVSTVWTACHLFFDFSHTPAKKRSFESVVAYTWDRKQEYAHAYDFTLLDYSVEMDFAVGELRSAAPPCGVASTTSVVPKVFEPTYAIGRAAATSVPMPTSGAIAGYIYDYSGDEAKLDRLISSAPIDWGFSGGPLFVRTPLGNWAVVGLNLGMQELNTFPLHHQAEALPTKRIEEWLQGRKIPRRSKK